jgi:hypothetical protein
MTMQTISAATIANVLLAAVFCFNADSVFADPPGTTDANLQLDDPVIAFEKIPEVFRTAAFLRGTAAFPNGGHFQGIQSYFDATQNRRICFLSHDSGHTHFETRWRQASSPFHRGSLERSIRQEPACQPHGLLHPTFVAATDLRPSCAERATLRTL